jgi:DNA repair protein RecO (recombination protein O)
LRCFEKRLLRELGYGLLLDRDVQGAAIDPQARYTYVLEAGPTLLVQTGARPTLEVTGKTLLDIASDDYRHPTSLQESRALMRYVLNHYLNGQMLHTRQLLLELQHT